MGPDGGHYTISPKLSIFFSMPSFPTNSQQSNPVMTCQVSFHFELDVAFDCPFSALNPKP